MEEHRPGRAIKDSYSYFQPLTLSSCLFQGNVVSKWKLPGEKKKRKKAQIALKVFPILKAPGVNLAFWFFVLVGQENTYLFKNICG